MSSEPARAPEQVDLNDMINELRVLLTGTILLLAFLFPLPFSSGFVLLNSAERWVFVATFASVLTSLILLVTPAAQHRLMRPLADPVTFKRKANQKIVMGTVAQSISLILLTVLVIAQVVGLTASLILGLATAAGIAWYWWIVPLRRLARQKRPDRERGRD